MSTRNLLLHIFRHGPREKVDGKAVALKPKLQTTEHATEAASGIAVGRTNHRTASINLSPPPKTPEPFGLEDIAEENAVDTSSTTETASLTSTLASLDLEISTFSSRELVYAILDEAKSAATFHLETISTTLSLLEALDGFSATISDLRREMLDKTQVCEDQLGTLNAVERAIEGMVFVGELQEHATGDQDAK